MRVLSGIQASGTLHLGNYFGAMKQHIEDQERHECYFFIANYHSLNTVQDAELLRKLTRDAALDYLAMGLDANRCSAPRDRKPDSNYLRGGNRTIRGVKRAQ